MLSNILAIIGAVAVAVGAAFLGVVIGLAIVGLFVATGYLIYKTISTLTNLKLW